MIGDESDVTPAAMRRGRGANSNRVGRFEAHLRCAVDDGWDLDEATPPLRTEVSIERARSVLTRNTSPDVPFDRSVNPYRGCEHGCVYCFARPSHAYLGLSPGLDFETRLIAKPDAPELLRAELARPGYTPAPIAIGTNTDPYQPIEKEFAIMRGVLMVLRDCAHPVTIVTKGARIERDIDVLGALAAIGLVQVGISLTTLDAGLARAMEPRAATPVIPGLTDHEIEALLTAARDAGATTATYSALRLPREVAVLFRDWLTERYPGRAEKIMGRVRQLHGGRDYDALWGRRMTGEGVHAALIGRRFRTATVRLRLDRPLAPLRCDLFRPPARDALQLSLF